MIWRGYKRISFSSVKMDVAEIRRRSKAANVADLAANIRQHGDEPIHAPTVRMPGKRLLCGRDRMAALMILKAKKLWVRLAECSDLEAADLEASENLHRRQDDRDEVIARAVRAKEALAAADDRNKSNDRPGASQKAIKAEARRQVARDLGTSPNAIKQAEFRARRAAAATNDSAAEGRTYPPPGAPAATAVEPAPFEPNLKLLGVPIEEGRAPCEMAAPAQEAIDEADRHLRLAQAALKRLSGIPHTIAVQLHDDVHRVASRVRSHRPELICPWCKHIPGLTRDCNACQTMGYVSAEKAMSAPSECLAEPPVVVVNGEFVPYADALAGKLPKRPAPAAKGGKRIRVEGPDGKEIQLED